MEYQFIRNTLLGQYSVRCEMGFEVIARWLQDEIAAECTKIDQVMHLIKLAQQQPNQEQYLVGQEISLLIQGDEVTIQENILLQEQELLSDEAFGFYDCESFAQCGLDDFQQLLVGWRKFVTER
ncbi:hypothetical protein CAG54_15120 [Vibrio sp. V27_P1S3P104]|uniref:UPF0231 family protein n=1 Tax=unclassified Vibrio TaxID=2614977 RepID=UPI0013726F3F|nr:MULTISPECIES: YacL family protein [unclassified Vibrio]NAW68989.1 hypothetical protein [Vibrio sp. V28_P6S34P95]NAX04244.1 hypothetical protein [Vibrio sp. V30_P3S12P165]NAX34424.1 hypothetical protein [Vibrio sp. V29_P1S30P107]NAX38833.1 hypothetical protein [Vibrio sp. V27_P1S3P104]NAX39359.1 hypothetical protein [Vibrio sp. V26_P1S5P106]